MRRTSLKRSSKSLRRRSPKYGKTRGEWHPQRIRLEGVAMSELRSEAFRRSDGFCENVKPDGFRCFAPINWFNFELAHVKARGKGGSDTLENVHASCRPCHHLEHGIPQWTKR